MAENTKNPGNQNPGQSGRSGNQGNPGQQGSSSGRNMGLDEDLQQTVSGKNRGTSHLEEDTAFKDRGSRSNTGSGTQGSDPGRREGGSYGQGSTGSSSDRSGQSGTSKGSQENSGNRSGQR